MKGIKVDVLNRKIVLNKSFVAKVSNPLSKEFEMLAKATTAYPTFEVVKPRTTSSDFQKITAVSMEEFITAKHENRLAALKNDLKEKTFATVKTEFYTTYKDEYKEFMKEKRAAKKTAAESENNELTLAKVS